MVNIVLCLHTHSDTFLDIVLVMSHKDTASWMTVDCRFYYTKIAECLDILSFTFSKTFRVFDTLLI